jgi:hypothetical protein
MAIFPMRYKKRESSSYRRGDETKKREPGPLGPGSPWRKEKKLMFSVISNILAK